ncbi:MAG: peroxiredoxin [Phycisphaeraceae bacterium]|nr:peroxiredoxin [Phycisphaeraceae bacterium]
MPLIDPGDKAPRFDLPDQNGKARSLKDYAGRIVVLMFYPKDDTPTCTVEACNFRDHHPDFSKVKATILGISPDDSESHKKFDRTHALGFTLLADTGRTSEGAPIVCDAYGVWQNKVMFGRRYKGVVRTTYLIDKNGIVRHRWDHVKVAGHVPAVLAAVKHLLGIEPAPGATRNGTSHRAPPGRAARGKEPAARVSLSKSPAGATHRKPRRVRGRTKP